MLAATRMDKMSVDTSENDLLETTQEELELKKTFADDKLNPLHLLQQAIANMPDIDTEKVQAVLQKLNQGAIDALGNESERLNSAKRIATKIIAETVHDDQEIPQ